MINKMTSNMILPGNWGKDSLSMFIEKAWQNTLASFANLKPQYNRLRDINDAFGKLNDKHIKPSEMLTSFFIMRSHASFLGGARFSLSGQLPEAYMVLRGCIENALYGLYVFVNPKSREIWLKRHDNEATEKQCKSEFTYGNVKNCLKKINAENYRIANLLYKETIDWGAHPNEKAILSLVSHTKKGNSEDFRLTFLSENTTALQLCLKRTAQVGICALEIFQNVYSERYDILGITDDLKALRKGL